MPSKQEIRVERIKETATRIMEKLAADPGNPKADAWRHRLAQFEADAELLVAEAAVERIKARRKNPGDVTIEVPSASLGVEGN